MIHIPVKQIKNVSRNSIRSGNEVGLKINTEKVHVHAGTPECTTKTYYKHSSQKHKISEVIRLKYLGAKVDTSQYDNDSFLCSEITFITSNSIRR